MIERQRTQEEIYNERVQAYEAEKAKQRRNMAERQREALEQNQRALTYQQPTQPPGGGWAERKARENAATSAGSIANNGGQWDRAAEAERKEEARRRAAQQPPSTITHCDPGFCYDNQGGIYHRTGPDFMTGPNGKACNRSGSTWICN